MKLKAVFGVIAVGLTLAGINANAVEYKGSISVGAGTMVSGGGWANFTGLSLSWVVDNTTNPGLWTYAYTFGVPGGTFNPGLSHGIVEVTDGATLDEFEVTGGVDNEVRTFDPSDPGGSNPGLPGAIFGIKVNTTGSSWTLVTDRAPVWQDFYAKGGRDAFAYNTGFNAVDPVVGPADGSIEAHILGPNGSTTVPDGGLTAMLLGLALSGMGATRRFLKK